MKTTIARRMSSAAALFAALALALLTTSCRRRAAGTCTEDIDCPPGYDCAAARCVRRPPAAASSTHPQGATSTDTPATQNGQQAPDPSLPPPGVAPERETESGDAGTSAQDAATRKPGRRAPPAETAQPAAPLPSPAPGLERKQPRWKERAESF